MRDLLQRYRVIIFDCDGVLLESNDVKTEAFASVFAEYPSKIKDIVNYHQANTGLSRFVKFRYIYESILSLPLSDQEAARVADRFAAAIAEGMANCQEVPGARAFLGQFSTRPLFVASGTPEDELRQILAMHGLAEYFVGIYGAPRSKTEIIHLILNITRCSPGQVLFIGDSANDREAALSSGVSFIARTNGYPRRLLSSPGLPVCRDLFDLLQRNAG